MLLLMQPVRCTLQLLQAARVPTPPPNDDDDDDDEHEEGINRVSHHVVSGNIVLHRDFGTA